MSETLTLHRALAEIKMLQKRITGKIEDLVVVGNKKRDGLVYNKTLEDFNSDAKADFQSIEDLIKRKNHIKSLIVIKNSETMVKIGDEEMSISDAITKKEAILFQEALLQDLKQQYSRERSLVERHNAQVDANALKLAETALNKENVNLEDTDVSVVVKPYLESNTLTVVDPLDVEKKIKSLEENIDVFKAEVDAVLSEANATTLITL